MCYPFGGGASYTLSMKRLVSTFIFLAAISTAVAASSAGKNSRRGCLARDLARQDCELKDGGYTVRLLAETVTWNDGTWHTVEPLPLKDNQIAWEKMNFEILAGRPILQLWIWDKGDPQNQVQSLNWLTVDLSNRKFVLLAKGVVRKRRPKADSKPQSYLYDGVLTHALKAQKSGELEWSLGNEKKILGKAEHGI